MLLAAFGLLLFAVLMMRRSGSSAPATLPVSASVVRSLPELALPPPIPESYPYIYGQDLPRPLPAPLPRVQSNPQPAPSANPSPVQSFSQPYTPAPATAPQASSQPRVASGPAVVFEAPGGTATASGGTTAQAAGTEDDPTALTSGADRVRAGAFLNRSTTIAQGTIISAVLETAFDSTGPGFARALVQRDIRGFDGSRVLVPRGSRLLGRYRAVPSSGQNRVLIVWFRLIRPDGVTIDIDSPAADLLGRGGVKAEVNTHFFERFASSILQSGLDIGVGLATRNADRSVIVALPGAVANTASAALPQATVPPTLRVRAGTSVSVFVARDLDFTGHE